MRPPFFARLLSRRRRTLLLGSILLLLILCTGVFSGRLPLISAYLLKPLSLFVRQLLDVLGEFELNVSRNVSDVQIILWTKESALHEYIFSEWHNTALRSSGFNSSHPTKIFFHGFSDFPRTLWTKAFRDHYLSNRPTNVFSVDWSLLAKSPWYTTAAKNANAVGEHVAGFIRFLISEGEAYENIHLLGASLGAHAAGYTGFYTEGRIGRITGLDPSGPLFHSSWRMYGLTIPVDNPPFHSVPCGSTSDFASGLCCKEAFTQSVIFGEHVDRGLARGTYYFKTGKKYPYALAIIDSMGCEMP
uniref:Phospholipase A1 member A n=1 Tax=Caligus rogercresseyi TaxID=217165 RepID=C1BRH9_CALRO|nr:Phospholipase A1 member A precursor [Caligus rogercresseyi]